MGRGKSQTPKKAAAAVVAVAPAPTPKETSRLLYTGMLAAVGIALHNAPEGLIVFNQTITGLCPSGAGEALSPVTLFGLPLPWLLVPNGDFTRCLGRGAAITAAIALHNIPEGMAVASPIYAATGSKWQALKYCILSSLFEPLGAILFGYAFSSSLTPALLAGVNAGVAGIMIALCLIELIPTACKSISSRVRDGRGGSVRGGTVAHITTRLSPPPPLLAGGGLVQYCGAGGHVDLA